MTIRTMVDRERRHLRRAELAAGVLLAAAVTAALIAVGAAVLAHARWLSLPRGIPFTVWALVAVVLGALAFRTWQRVQRDATRQHVALAIEQEQGMRRGLLVGVLELEGQSALADRAAREARGTLPTDAPLAPALRHASMRRTFVGAGAAAAGMLLLLTATPVFGDGLRAVLQPLDAWRGNLLARPHIDGAPLELLRGSPLRVTLNAPGRRVVYLNARQTGDAWRTDTVRLDPSTGRATWTIDALRGDVRLVLSDGRAASDSVMVRAADRPFVGGLTLNVRYPRYLGRSDESLPVGEPLRLPRGSVLIIAGRASVPLSDVALIAGDGVRIAFGTSGHAFSGQFVPERSAQLRWTARGPGGLVPDLPEPLDVNVVADSAPHVVIADPTSDTILVNNEPVALALQISDDHGLASVALHITRMQAQDIATITQPVVGAVGTSWSGSATIDIESLRIAAGDGVRVRAEAVDASPWAQRGVSREIVLRRATSEEQRTVARALGDSAVKEAQAAASAQRSLAQRTDEAARAQARQGSAKESQPDGSQSAASKAMKFENAEKARALSQEQRALADRVQRLRQATKQLEQQLKAAGALDTSLARQLSDAQDLMRQALTPELMAQMQKLDASSRQMNGEQSRDALRDLAQLQQRMREQLERSAEMLKRAAHEGALQTLGDEARELAKKERALADSASPGADKLAADARELADRSDRLRQEMENLKKRLEKDRADAAASRTEQAEQHAAKSESDMRKAASEMKSPGQKAGEPKHGAQQGQQQQGQPQQGQQGKQGEKGENPARDAAASMEQAAQAMQDARSEQVKEWKKELTSELDRSVQEMLQLAREERALEDKARAGTSPEDRRSAQSAVEQGVDKASQRLQGEGKKSALLSPRSQRAMADAKGKVSQATQSITQPNSSNARQASALSDAAEALTKAAASLARDRERANNANSASGFSEMLQQMQEMAQKQGQINGQAQSLMSMPNGASSSAGQAMSRALARQQRQLAEQLEEAGDATGGDRAAQLAREARQLAEALDNGRLDAGTIARQQQLFRRLLDAGRSLEKEERDDTGKRESKSAAANDAFTPGAKSDARAAVKFRPPTWDELRGLSVDERRAILDYFTRLNSTPGSAPPATP